MSNSKFSQEFELEVLKCLVNDSKFLKEAFSSGRPEYFISTQYANAFKVIIQSYVRTKSSPSKIGFLSNLVEEEKRTYNTKKSDEQAIIISPCQKIADYIFTPLSVSLEDIKSSFLTFCRQRETENCLLENLKKLEDGTQDISSTFENIKKVEKRIQSASSGGINLFDELENLEEKFRNVKGKMYTTGFPSLDSWMGGGMSLGTLSTIIAASKSGKSMNLAHIAYHNAKKPKTNVVFFTCEISQDKTEQRIVSRISGISLDDLYKVPQTVMEKCAQFYLDTQSNIFIKGYPPATASCADFRNYLYWLEGEHGVKANVILADYGDLIKPIDKHSETRHALNAVWTELRGLASEFNAVVITASQANREAFDKNIIRMKDVAEAIGKVNVSDHLWSICKTDEEEHQNKGRIFFCGSREARTGGIFPISYDWKHCIIRETNDKIKQTEAFE